MYRSMAIAGAFLSQLHVIAPVGRSPHCQGIIDNNRMRPDPGGDLTHPGSTSQVTGDHEKYINRLSAQLVIESISLHIISFIFMHFSRVTVSCLPAENL